MFGMERVPKSLSGAVRIESPYALQAFTHGRDAECDEFIKVIDGNTQKCYSSQKCYVGCLTHSSDLRQR